MTTALTTGLALLTVLGAAAAPAAWAWRTGDDFVALTEPDGAVVWQFNHPPAPMKPHFHPVGLPGRPALTWRTPPDHIWHLGLWFSWKYLNGVNYWETNAAGRSDGLTRVVRFEPTLRDDHSARLALQLVYQPNEDTPVVLHEQRVVDISTPAADGRYHLDWTMTFTAGEEPVTLDRTPLPTEPAGQPWGGYAGLIWRFAEGLTEWRVVATTGESQMDVHGARARGAGFSGQLEGQPLGVAMLEHPSSSRAPTPWYVALETETPFACLTPAPLFETPLRLAAGESFTLRYRVVVHPGRWDAAELQQAVDRYAAERP